MSTGSDASKTVQTSGPPSYLQPNIQQLSSDAQNLYRQGGPNPYPTSTVANVSPTTLQGWGATAARAANGSPLNTAAGGYINNTLSSGFNQAGNPQLDAVWKNISDKVTPQVNAQFELSGRYGAPGAQTDQLARSLTDAYAPYALQQFQGNQQLQQTAAQMAPGQANQDYTDLAALQGVGTARDAYAQSQLTDAANRYSQQQQQPYNNANWLASILYGNPAQTQTTKTPTPSTGLGGALGGFLGSIL